MPESIASLRCSLFYRLSVNRWAHFFAFFSILILSAAPLISTSLRHATDCSEKHTHSLLVHSSTDDISTAPSLRQLEKSPLDDEKIARALMEKGACDYCSLLSYTPIIFGLLWPLIGLIFVPYRILRPYLFDCLLPARQFSPNLARAPPKRCF